MIKCKKCGSTNVKVDYSSVCTSIPAKYQYRCQDCNELGFINCDEADNAKSQSLHELLNEFKGIGEPNKETINTPEEPKGGLMGWICPKCGRCYSPFTSMCPHCNNNDWSDWTKITCLG